MTSVIDRLSSVSPCRQSQAVRSASVIARVVRPLTDCAPTGDRWKGTLYTYNSAGQLTSATDGRGVYVQDTSIGQTPVAALNPSAPVAATRSYTYTSAGDLHSESSPPITTTNPTGTGRTTGPVTTTYGYDADGNQTAVTSTNGYKTTLSYDHLGRLTQATGPSVKLWDGGTRAGRDDRVRRRGQRDAHDRWRGWPYHARL